jgi:hypothetical protein
VEKPWNPTERPEAEKIESGFVIQSSDSPLPEEIESEIFIEPGLMIVDRNLVGARLHDRAWIQGDATGSEESFLCA